MNPFLEELFNVIGIDIEYLNGYLAPNEKDYLNTILKSIEDLSGDFYTSEQGENLEALLYFLFCHKKDITSIWEDRSKKKNFGKTIYLRNNLWELRLLSFRSIQV
ncbi:hypothetical protein HJ041_21985 [Vibrio parahaemolyticus]|nr:hypothetical protein [Vibrio parahaemolyticus]